MMRSIEGKMLATGVVFLAMSFLAAAPAAANSDAQVKALCLAAERGSQLMNYCVLHDVIGHMGAGEIYEFDHRCGREYFSTWSNQMLARRMIEYLLDSGDPLRAPLLSLIQDLSPVLPRRDRKAYPVIHDRRDAPYISCGYTDERRIEATGMIAGAIMACAPKGAAAQ